MEPPNNPNPLATVLGGIGVEITLRSGVKEKVNVRQLPIRLLKDWADLQGDEASLAELYCDRRNAEALARLRKLRGEEYIFFQQMSASGNPPEAIKKASEELAMVRAEIDKLERENRWDDELTPESHDEIIRLGEELNRPRFDRWMEGRHTAIGHLKTQIQKYAPPAPEQSAAPVSSASPSSSPAAV